MKRYEITYETWTSCCGRKHRIIKADSPYEARLKFERMMAKLNTNMGALEILKVEEA